MKYKPSRSKNSLLVSSYEVTSNQQEDQVSILPDANEIKTCPSRRWFDCCYLSVAFNVQKEINLLMYLLSLLDNLDWMFTQDEFSFLESKLHRFGKLSDGEKKFSESMICWFKFFLAKITDSKTFEPWRLLFNRI